MRWLIFGLLAVFGTNSLGLPQNGQRVPAEGAVSAGQSSGSPDLHLENLPALWQQAKAAFDRGDFAEARRLLSLAVKSNPRDAALWFHLGVANSQLGDVDQAIAALEKSRALAPRQPESYFDLGLLYWKSGDLGKAKLAYHSGLALNPKEPGALQNYSLLLMKTGDYKSAIAPLIKLKSDPALSAPARVSLIECYLKTQQPEAANREANDLLRSGTSQAPDETKLAGIFLENGATDTAMQLLTQSLKADPEQEKASATLGLIFLRQKRFSDAAPLLERAVQMDPTSAGYAMAFAQDLFLWNHAAGMLAFLQSVASRFSALPEFQFALGLAYYSNAKFTDAVTTLEGVQRANTRREDQVDFWLGNSYLAVGRLDDSEKAYRKAIEINPKNPEYYESLSTLLRREGPEKLDEAIAQLKHAHQYNPGDPRVGLQLALCYESKGDLASATPLLEKAVQEDTSLAPAHVALARVYFRQGEKLKAAQETATVKALQEKIDQEKMKSSSAPQSPLDEQP